VNVGSMSLFSFAVFVVATFGLAVVGRNASTPVLIAYLLLWIGSFAYAMYLWIAVIRYGDRRLLRRGVKGSAEVLSVKATSWSMSAGEYYGFGAPTVMKYRLAVSVPGKDRYETTLYICARLATGETLPVCVSPLNPARVTVDLAQHAAARSASAPGPAGAVHTHRRIAMPSGVDVADELTKLADLRDRGALSDSEFEARKAKLLQGD
jgi:hypothetical protein